MNNKSVHILRFLEKDGIVVEGKYYPRHAITNEGIVFSYQTYEKGANFDGVLHFVQPYKNDFQFKR